MGNLLHAARKRHGLTQDQLAGRVGVSRVHVGDMERLKKPASLAVAIALIDALGLDDSQAMALLRELATAGAEGPPATTPAPPGRPHQEAA